MLELIAVIANIFYKSYINTLEFFGVYKKW